MDALVMNAKRTGRLWLAGFWEACALHRVVLLCLSSRALSIRMGQCFLLNGLIFLGSLLTLKSFVMPTLLWILPRQCEEFGLHNSCEYKFATCLYSFLRSVLVQLFYIFWFYPLYVFSFILSTFWYNDIAKHGYDAVKVQEPLVEQPQHEACIPDSQNSSSMGRPGGFEGIVLNIGEQIYSVLLLTFFFIEVLLTGYIPYIGKPINFLLLSWMYSYYCFEYKWNLSGVTLQRRLDFFQSNWAFFSGFGSPCVLAIFFFSPLVSYGVMAILYPLFVLTAADTQAEQVINSIRRPWIGGGPGKLPIFYAADKLSMQVLQLFPKDSKEH